MILPKRISPEPVINTVWSCGDTIFRNNQASSLKGFFLLVKHYSCNYCDEV